jgi:hypothetical protein
MIAPDKNVPEPEEMVAEFYGSICEMLNEAYEAEMGEPPGEAWLQSSVLFYFKMLFYRRRPRWEVDALFAKLGPRSKREDSHWRRGQLVRQYGRFGKPPKLKFARWAAKAKRRSYKARVSKERAFGFGHDER